MKVTIEKLVRTECLVSIPDQCRICGDDFNIEPNSLVQDNWASLEVSGSIETDHDGVQTFQASGSRSDLDNRFIVTGYRCQCGHVLASTEGE